MFVNPGGSGAGGAARVYLLGSCKKSAGARYAARRSHGPPALRAAPPEPWRARLVPPPTDPGYETMSQAAGKKGGKGPPKKNADDDKAVPPKVAEEKVGDETSSVNGDKKEVKENNGAEVLVKPPSAGVNMRDVAAKILVLAQKGEWPAVEQTLKVLEKLVTAGGEDTVTVPMAGILDPVSAATLCKG